MKSAHKFALNSGLLYFRIIVSAVATIFSTRIALEALGVDDFGLYNLIGGVIALMAFLNGALLSSGQRFMSVAVGSGNAAKLKAIFNAGLMIHIVLGLAIMIIMKLLQPLLFNGFLSIKPEQIEAAVGVYNIMIFSALVTILAIPFGAAINAREDMWFSAVVEIVVSILKLGAAVYILYATSDLLLKYTFLMFLAILAGAVATAVWCFRRYSEVRIAPRLMIHKYHIGEQVGFITWNTLGSLSEVFRNQGLAVVLNIFYGTAVNAAYGIANQLNSIVLVFASTLTTVFSPKIMKEYASGSVDKALSLSVFSSKLSLMVCSVIALPLATEAPTILGLWLTDVPQYTVEFCRVIIFVFVVRQFAPGIVRGIYAQGDIKWYMITFTILVSSNIFVGYFLLYSGYGALSVLIVMLILQCAMTVATVMFARKKIGLDCMKFAWYILKFLLLFAIFYGIIYSMRHIIADDMLRLVVVILFTGTVYAVAFYAVIFENDERNDLKKFIKQIVK